MSLICFGVRGLEAKVSNREVLDCYLEFRIQPNFIKKTDVVKYRNGGLQMGQLIEFELSVPRNKEICPILEVKLMECQGGKDTVLLGLGQIDLKELLER